MPFGLTMGTERANALQQSIQDELMKRGYSPDADPVMAEYITIMVINNKTAAQITTELEDLIGSEFGNVVRPRWLQHSADFGPDPTFTDWLFAEAAKGASGAEAFPQPQPLQPQPPAPPSQPSEQPTVHEPPPHIPRDNSNRPSHPPRNGIYQQAVSQATSGSSQKRSASARSPSPSHPNKSRRTDLPTGPRAMQREGVSGSNPRSLLDRMGGHAGPNRHQRDEIQARIDNITNNSPEPNMLMGGGFPGMPMGMDINAMAMANPLMLQEMFMNNMALMQQLSSQIGMMQGFAPGLNIQGGVPGEIGVFPGGPNNFGQVNRGRGGGRGGRGTGRGRGGSHGGTSSLSKPTETATSDTASLSNPLSQPSPAVAPTPAAPTPPAPALTTTTPIAAPVPTPATPQMPYTVPERPQSPTLCKFGLKCTNAHCRWSHPSPVATPESGVVLSNEACEAGKNCKDKDCIKAHVSPAVLNPPAQQPSIPAPAPVAHQTPSNPTPCRFGLACTRPNSCTRSTCPYQHPEGRVLPTSFHRGLATNGPLVNVPTPETGTMGPSPHRSVTFNNPKVKLEKQVKELEERKNEAEKAIKEAQATANASPNANGKEEPKPVATAA
ncbi:hypothetical protein P691DRAFT_786944 [Macrolepiota fuliginosa MF-IS2]|uniref:C3H1-type domain-containing protein n=1 Tax=Macrolepiota fuliginosa MF-IS2 TaxID=1400762 RepID=A0A9P5XKT1_9AGAR|nr:hypothetical protein P691DRAFT_786944 [Macrolepiota fuliginosa MF-IS2]